MVENGKTSVPSGASLLLSSSLSSFSPRYWLLSTHVFSLSLSVSLSQITSLAGPLVNVTRLTVAATTSSSPVTTSISCRKTNQEGRNGDRGDISPTPLHYPLAEGAVMDDNISVDFEVDAGTLVDRAGLAVIDAPVVDIADRRLPSLSSSSSSSSGRRQRGGWIQSVWRCYTAEGMG